MPKEDFFITNERRDWALMRRLNDSKGWFTTMTRNELFDRIDVTAVDRKGRTVNIELKSRFMRDNVFDKIFIEKEKYDALMFRWNEYGEIPLYINFFNNTTAVWDLRNMGDLEVTTARIYNRGRNVIEDVCRVLLPMSEAVRINSYNFG